MKLLFQCSVVLFLLSVAECATPFLNVYLDETSRTSLENVLRNALSSSVCFSILNKNTNMAAGMPNIPTEGKVGGVFFLVLKIFSIVLRKQE